MAEASRAAALDGASEAWASPPERIEPAPGEVHVWRAALDVEPGRAERLAALLSPDERERAGRFRFARHRSDFIAARAFLRLLLGRYTGRAPSGLQFEYNRHGKPRLAGADVPLRFNLSHARGLALYAVALGRETGVDVEHVERDLDAEGVAARFLPPGDRALLAALSGEEREKAFLACWTRREALLKARGEGLAALDAEDAERRSSLDWSVMELNPGPSPRRAPAGAPGAGASRYSRRSRRPAAGFPQESP